MANMKRFSEDEIRAACKKVCAQQGSDGVIFVAREQMLATLNAPTLRPGQPVMYDYEDIEGLGPCVKVSYVAEIPDGATNIRALFTEDEVMDESTRLFQRVWQGDLPWDKARDELQARLDAIKYGSSYE